MRPRRSEGRRDRLPSVGNGYVTPTAPRPRLQLAVTDHHRPLQALLAGGGEERAHLLKPAVFLTKPIECRVAPLL
jgi:hypothetical protein